MTEVRQGEIYWFDFGPRIGSAPAEMHPCVVVQSDLFNRTRLATTVVCVISSNPDLARASGNIVLKRGEGNLPKTSIINISQIATVDKSDLVDRIGKLPAATVDKIRGALSLLFERV